MEEDDAQSPVQTSGTSADLWNSLRRVTPARIGLGRNGDAMPLAPVLDFQLAHAKARDAVHAALDVAAIVDALAPRPVVTVRSQAADRTTFLKRPDLGRALDPACLPRLSTTNPSDCVFVIADGLSAIAVARHAVPLIAHSLQLLDGLVFGPTIVATQARVALGDAIGAALQARVVVLLIGERPGLSVADSLGVYITFEPKIGRRDSERNCISNIHPNGGLAYETAARKLAWLVREALARRVTGIALKDAEMPALTDGRA